MLKQIFVAGLMAAVAATPGFSQAVYGTIVGTVVDPTGAAVAGAKVTITDTGRDVATSATTNESGNFTQRFLIAGRYRVRVEAAGFKALNQENVGVSVDTETRLDLLLQVGDVTQTMEVSSEAGILKTERSDVSTMWSEKTVTNLPILSRRFTNLQLMTPGVVSFPTSLTAASAENPQGSYRMLVNGQSFAGTSHLLDGTDNHDAVLGWIVINPTLESVTEAKITTANYDAEFGVASAGVVSAQTKSGTNQMHGSAFWFLRNDHMQARNPFTQSRVIPNSNGRLIPLTQWNQFGASLGGPILKNKLFYFGDFQGTRRNTGGGALLRVPTLEERAGDLRGLNLNIFDPASGATPATRTQFPNNVIPANRLSAQTQALLRQIPGPNINAVLDQPNFASSGGVKSDDEAINTRVDHYTTEKLHIFGRYSLQQFRVLAPGSFGLVAGGPGLDASGSTNAYAGKSDSRNHSIAGGFDYSVKPTLLTDFRFGWFRYKVFGQPNGIGTAPAKDAGIPGLNVDDNFNSGMPAFFINGYGNNLFRFGYALGVNGCNCPLIQDENQYQFVNNWTAIKGNHTFKFGGDIRQAHNLRVPSDRHRSGELNFEAARTQGGSGGGSGLASFLVGDVTSFSRYVSNSLDARETQNRWFFFAQDSWRVTKKLTVNYGLRWEIYRPQFVNQAGNGGFLNSTTGEVMVAGQNGVGSDLNVKAPWTNFAPRLGIAYQLNSKTVVRTGYGRGYNLGVFGSIFGHNVTQNLPVLGIQSDQPAQNFDRVFTLANGPTALNPGTILAAQPKGPNGFNMLPNGVTAFMITNPIRFPTVDAWNFTVQRQIGNFSLEAAYVGTKGTHVFAGTGGDYDPNQADINGFGTLTTNQRKPFFQKFGWAQNLRYYGSDASNNYHSIQIRGDRRFSSGLSVMSHYTFSKNIDYEGTYYPRDAKLARGPSSNNRPHVFFVGSLYEIPVGRGRKFLSSGSKVAEFVLGGWQMNGTYNWMSGQPLTPSYRDCNADRDTGWCRPDLIGDYSVSDPSQFGWFKTASVPLTANGQIDGPWQRPQRAKFGTIGRNMISGPSFAQMDLSFFKSFTIKEGIRTQFRAESFNFLNHTNLANPNACVDCPGVAGRIFGAFANYVPRQWQMALKVEF
ncbi:MAG: TonB-dependent receptor [Acidobacteria bacterium]|nr:TonB-dependent receptor [Acidobacteriota bacterium]